jgi:hypothetical protein
MKQKIVFTFGAWSVVRVDGFTQNPSKAKWSVYCDDKFYCSHKTKKNCISFIQNIVKVFS